MIAAGPFDVKLMPQPPGEDAVLGRLTLDKKFHGDLEATSKGQMLAFSSSVKNSAGYVAMEQVAGTLQGRQGTFVLQHSGTMTRGNGQLVVTVVPDSGTDELVGLSGSMRIDNAGGKHSYVFEYTIAGAA
jgi:flagellar basal body rod protein FlgG